MRQGEQRTEERCIGGVAECVFERSDGGAMAGQIFSGNINAMAISWMMIYMLLFAVAWEAWSAPL